VATVHRLTAAVVAEILNRRGQSQVEATTPAETTTAAGQEQADGRRRRAAVDSSFEVELVKVDPAVKDSRLRTAIVASDQGQNIPLSRHLYG